MGIRIETLADEAVSTIKTEVDRVGLEMLDLDRLIHEAVDGSVPIYNGDLAEYLAHELALGYDGDSAQLSQHDDIWNFLKARIYEEVDQLVRPEIQELLT